jgi:HAD superfamily hydrolase (TIGR01450 family)
MEEIADAELELTSDAEKAEVLVVGYDSEITYEKMTHALRALLMGAKFVATNDDGMLPSEVGYLPGAGAMVGAIRGIIKREPDVIIGKPNTELVNHALESMEIKASDCVLVGDSLHSDILLANRLNMTSVLVMSGNTLADDEIRRSTIVPNYVIPSIAELPGVLLESN